MGYYVLDSNPYDFEYIMRIAIPDDSNIDMRAVYFGHTQYINEDEEYIKLVSATNELPDIYNYDIPLVSLKMKEIMDDLGVENILYKPVILVREEDESCYQYYLPVVKHIECVIWEKSVYEDKGEGLPKDITGGFKIDQARTGNFKIFKIKDAINEIWIINDVLKEAFEEAGIKGAVIIETDYYMP